MTEEERNKEQELDSLFGIPSAKLAEDKVEFDLWNIAKPIGKQIYDNLRGLEEDLMAEKTAPFIDGLRKILPDEAAVHRVARGLGFLIVQADAERFQKEICIRGKIPYAFGQPYGGSPKFMNDEIGHYWMEWPDELSEERKAWAEKHKEE